MRALEAGEVFHAEGHEVKVLNRVECYEPFCVNDFLLDGEKPEAGNRVPAWVFKALTEGTKDQ